MSAATASSVAMDGYGQSLLGHNYYGFNLLQPSYHDEQSFKVDCSLDDGGFGFDPSPTEEAMLGQYPNTTDLLTASTYQLPSQLSPTFLFQHSNDHSQLPMAQYSTLFVPGLPNGVGCTSAEPNYEAVRLPKRPWMYADSL